MDESLAILEIASSLMSAIKFFNILGCFYRLLKTVNYIHIIFSILKFDRL